MGLLYSIGLLQMRTYATLAQALKIPKLRATAQNMQLNPDRALMIDPKTGITIVRRAGAIPRRAKRVTPLKENLKSLGWFLLAAVSYGSVIGGFLFVLGGM